MALDNSENYKDAELDLDRLGPNRSLSERTVNKRFDPFVSLNTFDLSVARAIRAGVESSESSIVGRLY